MAQSPEKLRRTNLINRRSVAWLLEVTLIVVVLIPPLFVLYLKLVPEDVPAIAAGETPGGLWLAQLGLWAAYILVRDLLGSASWGKRLVGLAIAPADGGDGPVAAGRRLLRSVPIAIPLMPIAEFFVAFYGNDRMQRLGDQWAGTRIEDRSPERLGKGSFSGPLLLAFILLIVAQMWAVPRLALFWAELVF